MSCPASLRSSAYGRAALVAAPERALVFRRFGAADGRAILAAGAGTLVPWLAGKPAHPRAVRGAGPAARRH
jgi:hypothetical protein